MRPSFHSYRVGLVAALLALAVACSASDPAGAPTKVEAGPGEGVAVAAPTAAQAGPIQSAAVSAPTATQASPGEAVAVAAPTATQAGPIESAAVSEPTATPLKPELIAESVATADTAASSDESSFAALHAVPFKRMNGETLRIADLKGKAVVLNFWASWCAPCRWEMPAFESIWQEYEEKGVVFVGVAVSDDERDAREFSEKIGVTYPLLVGDTNALTRAYMVTALPTTVLLDRDGNKTRHIANPANEAVLRLFLKGLLREG